VSRLGVLDDHEHRRVVSQWFEPVVAENAREEARVPSARAESAGPLDGEAGLADAALGVEQPEARAGVTPVGPGVELRQDLFASPLVPGDHLVARVEELRGGRHGGRRRGPRVEHGGEADRVECRVVVARPQLGERRVAGDLCCRGVEQRPQAAAANCPREELGEDRKSVV
jgi:hypothetical protein